MTRAETDLELLALRAKPTLLASEQRRVDYLEQRLAETDADSGLEEVRALMRDHLARRADLYGLATTEGR